MVEWTQSSEDSPRRPVDHQLSYETEWDMINAVSFRRKAHTHGDGKTIKSNVAEILFKEKASFVSNCFYRAFYPQKMPAS